MKNKKNKSIYEAFNSLNTMNEGKKQYILNEVIKGNKKKRFYNYGKIAVPVLVALILCVNIGVVFNNIKNNVAKIEESNYESESEAGIETISIPYETEREQTSENIKTVPTAIETEETVTEENKETKITTVITNPAVTNPTPTVTQAPQTTSAVQVTTVPQYNSNDGLPPLNDDLKQLFNNAYNIYKELSMGLLATQGEYTTINGVPGYVKVNDSRFTSVKDMSDYLHKYFTDNMLADWRILDKFIDGDDGLYTNIGAKGGTIGYSGHVFEITSQTDDQIDFEATIYIANNMDDIADQPFYTTPQNPEKYDTYKREFSIVKEDSNWRVDKMAPLF